jgi:hypothetical protein
MTNSVTAAMWRQRRKRGPLACCAATAFRVVNPLRANMASKRCVAALLIPILRVISNTSSSRAPPSTSLQLQRRRYNAHRLPCHDGFHASKRCLDQQPTRVTGAYQLAVPRASPRTSPVVGSQSRNVTRCASSPGRRPGRESADPSSISDGLEMEFHDLARANQ